MSGWSLALVTAALAVGFFLIVGGIVWLIAGWIGVTDNTRLIVSTQAPIIALVILWGVAIYANGRPT